MRADRLDSSVGHFNPKTINVAQRLTPICVRELKSMSDQSYTVVTFCAAEKLSRSMLYKLWSQGKGPRFYLVGTVRRISHEARIEWQRQHEAETVRP
jgi:hypothetical protein